ncbi:MAG: hypothetical protein K6T75_08180 [Acetobacteraceae bacterium]|nr:hypothetical protein [Acetobacteraceae bacterium]
MDQGCAGVRSIRVLAGVPGKGGFGGDGGPADEALLLGPAAVAVDGRGNVYIADAQNHRVRKVDVASGRIETVAGSGRAGFSGDGGPPEGASLCLPLGVAVDPQGNVYIADAQNHRIRRVEAGTGAITTLAGTGERGFAGDGGPGAAAKLAMPAGVLWAGERLLTNDFLNNRVRAIDSSGTIDTLISGDTPGGMQGPYGIALDGQGRLYVADYGNQRVARFDAEKGCLVTFAGGNGKGFSGDGGPATSAQLADVHGLAFDASDNAYIADYGNRRVRRVDAATGVITTVAGSGEKGPAGAGGPAVQAALGLPAGVAVDRGGRLYIPDFEAHCVWVVE